MSATVVVRTPSGDLRGRVRSAEAGSEPVLSFTGVPFAEATRFGPPGAVAPWTGERDATEYGPAAPQAPSMLDHLLAGEDLVIAEEGCLSANVWTPAADGRRRPVLVWIHGGAFTNGTGRSRWFDGSSLVRRGDVVVVTANYRLGVLGFAHGITPGSGNLGLLDQVALLRWVREHIASFGGDPDDVTVFGESAGGASVVALLSLPHTEGLFHKAVSQSPSLTQMRSAERAAAATAELLGHLGVDGPAALAGLPLQELIDAQQKLMVDFETAATAAAPTADGEVMAASVAMVAEAAASRRVPLLLGTTRDEMALFSAFDPSHAGIDDALLAKIARRTFGERSAVALDAYRSVRPGAAAPALATAIATDATFRMPAVRLAEARAAVGSPTWLYWFTWATPAFGGILGACHGIDIPFVFHNLRQPGVDLLLGSGDDLEPLADAVADTWLSFARTGECPWPTYETSRRDVLRIDTERELVSDPERETRQAWDGVSAWP